MNPTSSPFDFLFGAYYAGVINTTATQVGLGLAAVATVIIGLIAIYVALLGITMIWGKLTMAEFQSRTVRVILVAAFLSPAVFNGIVVNLFQNQLPTFSMLASTGAVTGATLPQQFDQIGDATDNMITAAKMQTAGVMSASLGIVGAAQRLEISIIGGLIAMVLLLSFLIAMASSVLTALLLDILSITFVAYLFKKTEDIADRTVGKLISMALVLLVTEIVVQQMLLQDRQYLGTLGAVSDNIEMEIASLWRVALVFLAGLFELGLAVGVAVYIGGGVNFSVLPLVSIFASKMGVKK